MLRSPALFVATTLALLVAACGGVASTDQPVDEADAEREIFANVNIAIHDVPLE